MLNKKTIKRKRIKGGTFSKAKRFGPIRYSNKRGKLNLSVPAKQKPKKKQKRKTRKYILKTNSSNFIEGLRPNDMPQVNAYHLLAPNNTTSSLHRIRRTLSGPKNEPVIHRGGPNVTWKNIVVNDNEEHIGPYTIGKLSKQRKKKN